MTRTTEIFRRVLSAGIAVGVATGCAADSRSPLRTIEPIIPSTSPSRLIIPPVQRVIVPTASPKPEITTFDILSESLSGFLKQQDELRQDNEGKIIPMLIDKDFSVQRLPYVQSTIDNKGLVQFLCSTDDPLDKQATLVISRKTPEEVNELEKILANNSPEGRIKAKTLIIAIQLKHYQLPGSDTYTAFEIIRIAPTQPPATQQAPKPA